MKSGKGWRCGFLAALVAVMVMGLSAGIASAGEQTGRKSVTLEPVKVTAQKQEETAQETPVSLTVMSETDIDDKMVESVEELVRFVPNMASFNTSALGENVITMRGITADPSTRSTSAGMYIDGVPVLSSIGYTTGLMDVERIEVLRGPQGTLYGKGTEAGVVSIITARPTNEYKTKMMVEGGRQLSGLQGHRFNGAVSGVTSGPIVKDTLYFQLAGRLDHKDGFIRNTFTGEPEYELGNAYGDAKLRWTPMPALDMTLTLSGESKDSKGNNADQSAMNRNRSVSSDLRGRQDADVNMQALNVGYAINDNLKLTSITSRRFDGGKGKLDFDFGPTVLVHGWVDSERTRYSQEFRLNGELHKWDWLVGLYLDNEKFDMSQLVDTWGANPAPPPALVPVIRVTDTDLKGNCYAGYVNVGYDITDDLKILGGARYEYQKYKFSASTIMNGTPLLGFSDSKSWTNISPKIGLQYQVIPESMLYATVSQGYRPGGFNDRANLPQYYSYDSERLWSYEVGVKNTLMDNKLLLNLALFYMDISNAQVSEQTSFGTLFITNAAEATSMGVELDATAIVTDNITLNGGFGYTHAEFDKFEDAGGSYKGNKLPYAPEYTYNLGAQYRTGAGLYARGDVVGYGKTYLDKGNTGYRNGYTLVNCKVGYETTNWDVYLYGKNIFDTKYDAKNWSGMDIYSEPGDFGLQATVRF